MHMAYWPALFRLHNRLMNKIQSASHNRPLMTQRCGHRKSNLGMINKQIQVWCKADQQVVKSNCQ